MAEKKAFTFTVDELELVSFLRDGRGALEEEVDVDWDLNRCLILPWSLATLHNVLFA